MLVIGDGGGGVGAEAARVFAGLGSAGGQLQLLCSGSVNTGGDFISSTAHLLHDTLYFAWHHAHTITIKSINAIALF